MKNRYIGRTFIMPDQSMREIAVRLKMNTIRPNIEGHKLVLVDDSKWFDGRNQYPTMEWMQDFVRRHLPGYVLEDAMHIIRIAPE